MASPVRRPLSEGRERSQRPGSLALPVFIQKLPPSARYSTSAPKGDVAQRSANDYPRALDIAIPSLLALADDVID
jgi:hypothetical protein